MMKFLGTFVCVLFLTVSVWAGDGIREKLQRIPQISGIEKMDVDSFEEYYQFWYEQPLDHADPSKGTFKQKVLLGHKKVDSPVVAVLEGYYIYSPEANELTKLFTANQLTIEHRFFDRSAPQGQLPWEYLTIKQAAADHHEIIRALKEYIYSDSKWITTGVSKGGQATLFHRYFYPEDVDISVPYVAPLNLEYIDPRIERFLSRLGGNKLGVGEIFGGGDTKSDCRWVIRDFQMLAFELQDRLVPLLEKYASEKNYTYTTVGGIKRALQLMILEYPFAFWQWGASCEEVPDAANDDLNVMFEYLVRISTPEFFEDHYLERMAPFFYMALTETGMYNYDIKPFKKFLNDEENIDFSFAFPKDAVKRPFNTKQMRAINKWLQADARNILFVYGGSDPWYATAVDLKMNGNCSKYVRGDMGHACKISDMDPVSREDLIDTLKKWLKQ